MVEKDDGGTSDGGGYKIKSKRKNRGHAFSRSKSFLAPIELQ